MARGEWVDDHVENATLLQGWDLDATGNWSPFNQTDADDPSRNPIQFREQNTANEIVEITDMAGPDWVDPTYDRNGNTLTTGAAWAMRSERMGWRRAHRKHQLTPRQDRR